MPYADPRSTEARESAKRAQQKYREKLKSDPSRCNGCTRKRDGDTKLCSLCLAKRAEYHQRRKSDTAYQARRKAGRRRWLNENPGKEQEYNRRSYIRHKEARVAYVRAYRKANPEWNSERARRRRAKEKAVLRDLTVEQWDRIWEEHEGLCVYCGDLATEMDHVIPLDRGGPHTASNVVPACRPCNASKGAKLLSEWTPPHDATVTKRT